MVHLFGNFLLQTIYLTHHVSFFEKVFPFSIKGENHNVDSSTPNQSLVHSFPLVIPQMALLGNNHLI